MREAGDERGAVERLELVEPAAVHDPRNDLAHVVGRLPVRRHDAVNLFGIVVRLLRLAQVELRALHAVQVAERGARERERVVVVQGVMVGHAGDAGMDVRPAQLLRAHNLAGGGLHQRRAAEEDRALALHDHRLVGHGRHIGPARGAGAHHHGDLRDSLRRHGRLVVEDASEMGRVREHLVLLGQVGAAGIHQIDAGQPVLARDLLGAEVLLDRQRVVGAALDGGVIGDDDAFAPVYAPDAGDDAGRGDVVLIDAPGGELGELQEGRAGVEQAAHPVAGQELAARQMALAGSFAAAFLHPGHGLAQVGRERLHRVCIGAELPSPRP